MVKGSAKTDDWTTFNYNEESFIPYVKTDYTLFRLLGENSPFQEELIWSFNPLFFGTVPAEGVTTDFYQFIVVVRNSEASVAF